MGRAVTTDLRHAVARAGRAEDQVRRTAQLMAMSRTDLTLVLGGDPAQSAPWVEAAAACGMAAAQLRLGRMLLDGTGVPRDLHAALRWFLKAARTGNAEAQNMAGRCLELSWGCDVDLTGAARWFAKSAAAGDAWGEYNYANMLFDGRGVDADQVAAVVLYDRAARRGHARAMNLLARCHEEGWGTPRHAANAAHWYRLSAEAGYFRAQYNHGIELLRQGRRDEARLWLERAGGEADETMRARIAACLAAS